MHVGNLKCHSLEASSANILPVSQTHHYPRLSRYTPPSAARKSHQERVNVHQRFYQVAVPAYNDSGHSSLARPLAQIADIRLIIQLDLDLACGAGLSSFLAVTLAGLKSHDIAVDLSARKA